MYANLVKLSLFVDQVLFAFFDIVSQRVQHTLMFLSFVLSLLSLVL